MDSPVVAVLALVALFVAIAGGKWLMDKAASKAGAKLHQAFNRSDLKAGNELYGGSWDWKTDVSWRTVLAAVEQELAALQARLPGLRVIAESAEKEVIAFGFNFKGARISQGSVHFGGLDGLRKGSEWEFSAGLSIVDEPSTGRALHFEFLSMKTFDGVSRCVDEMQQLLAMIERAIEKADPKAAENVVERS